MSLFQPNHLFRFLESIGHKPSRHLSQNFLIDGNILKKIIDAADLQPGDVVIEIGPGPGVLTEALLAHPITVIAIEKDRVFAKALERLQTPTNSLKIFQDDILEFPLLDTLKKHLQPTKKAKIISNLPYHLTAPIFAKILPLGQWLETIIVMVQKEVAERMVSKKDCKTYSSFSLFTQFYSQPKLLFSVSPGCFYPQPKVTSAVVECKLKPLPEDIDPSLFSSFVRKSFATRRKMLVTSLKEYIDKEKLQAALHTLSLNEKVRPENLSLEEFLQLFRLIYLV
ncbi:MAG: 16S rRNA (adenine(1518)-N(6)/adenine(1519)-N(6))-dimethyltransferase RsmA [Chlamydiota bacterium]